jgi:hypothetical protein
MAVPTSQRRVGSLVTGWQPARFSLDTQTSHDRWSCSPRHSATLLWQSVIQSAEGSMGRRKHIRRSYRRRVLAIRRQGGPGWLARAWRRSTSTVWGALGVVVPVLVILGLSPVWLPQIRCGWLDSVSARLEPSQWSGVWQVQVAIAAIALPLLLLTLTAVRDEWMFAIQSRTVLLRESWILLAWQYAVGGTLVIGLHSVFTASGGAVAVDTVAIVCPTLLLTAVALYRVLGLLLDSEKLRSKAASHAGEVLRDSLAETVSTNVARNAAAKKMSECGIYVSPYVVDWPDSLRVHAELRGDRELAIEDIDEAALEELSRVVAPLRERIVKETAAGPVQATKNIGDVVWARSDTLLVLRMGHEGTDEALRAEAETAVRRAFVVRAKRRSVGLPEAHKAMLDQVVAHLTHLIGDGAVTSFEADLERYGSIFDTLLADAAAYREAFGDLEAASSYHWPGRHRAELERLKEDVSDIMEAVVGQDRFAMVRAFISFLEGSSSDALARHDGEFAGYLLSRAVDVYRAWVGGGRPGADSVAGMVNLRLDHAIEYGPLRDRLEDESGPGEMEAVSRDLGSLLKVWNRYLLATFSVRNESHFRAACETLNDALSTMLLEAAAHRWDSPAAGEDAAPGGLVSVLHEFEQDRLTVFFGVGTCILRWMGERESQADEAAPYLSTLPLPVALDDLTRVFGQCVDVLHKGDPLDWERYGEAPFMKPVMVRPMVARIWLTHFWARQALLSTDLQGPSPQPISFEPSATIAAVARGKTSELHEAMSFLRDHTTTPQDLGNAEFEARCKSLLDAASSAASAWDGEETGRDK